MGAKLINLRYNIKFNVNYYYKKMIYFYFYFLLLFYTIK